MMGMPTAKKNSITRGESGAPPEMQKRRRPPTRSRIFAPTRWSASFTPKERSVRPAKWARAAAVPRLSPHRKMSRRGSGSFAAFSITRAYTFS